MPSGISHSRVHAQIPASIARQLNVSHLQGEDVKAPACAAGRATPRKDSKHLSNSKEPRSPEGHPRKSLSCGGGRVTPSDGAGTRPCPDPRWRGWRQARAPARSHAWGGAWVQEAGREGGALGRTGGRGRWRSLVADPEASGAPPSGWNPIGSHERGQGRALRVSAHLGRSGAGLGTGARPLTPLVHDPGPAWVCFSVLG